MSSSKTTNLVVGTVSRAICSHGAVNSLELVTVRTSTGYSVKASQSICKHCLEEIGADLAKNTMVLASGLSRALTSL